MSGDNPLDGLAEGVPTLMTTAGGIPIILLRLASGLVAYRNACPHMGIELDWDAGRLLSRSRRYLRCSAHGALFRLDDGYCIAGPCKGEALKPIPIDRATDGLLS